MSRLIISCLDHKLTELKLCSKLKLLRKLPYVQCTRGYRPRKPFWLPVAKSKMFKFHVQPTIPMEEDVELVHMYNVYKTSMKSIWLYYKERLMAQTTGPEVIEERKRIASEQHAKCVKENDVWNAEVAKLREQRLAKEAVTRERVILEKIITHEKNQKKFIDQLDAYIRTEKEAAKSFVTPENIDEAIETALSNVVDYNFCIDVGGNIYKGRYGKPPTSPVGTKPTTYKPPPEQEKVISMEATN